jgi:hypothetical protein
MKRKPSATLLALHEVDELILKILFRNRFGLSTDKVRKDLPPSHRISKDQINSRLKALVSGGKIYAWNPPPGKAKKPPAPIYSLEPLEQLVASEVQEILKNQPLTPAEIKKKFPAHINKYLLCLLEPLIKNKTVKWHPPLKGKRLGLEEPNPADFLSPEIRKLFEKGEKLGFQAEAILESANKYYKSLSPQIDPTSTNAEDIILKTMTALESAAAKGALVYIPDLRKALLDTFPNKKSFDQAILHLAKLGKVQLQSHSFPGELTEEKRLAMIDNTRGSYFMAVGIRME